MSDFGAALGRLMQERGIGVRELHRRSGYSAGYITQLRQGLREPSADAARDFDDALGAGGALAGRVPIRKAATGSAGSTLRTGGASAGWGSRALPAVVTAPTGPRDGGGGGWDLHGQVIHARWPGARQSRPWPGYGVDWHVELPAGRVLDGRGRVAVQVRQMARASDGTCFLPAWDSRLGEFAETAQRGMLIGVEERDGAISVRVLDIRYVRARARAENRGSSATTSSRITHRTAASILRMRRRARLFI